MRRAQRALLVACPRCNRVAGQRCRSTAPGRRAADLLKPHRERVELAEQARRA